MKLRTEIDIPRSSISINHFDKIVTIGSCFAENIGDYFFRYKFNICKNPFGVLYNPVSILNSLKCVETGKSFSIDDLIYNQHEWHSFYFHSDFSSHEAEACLKHINETVLQTREFLLKSDVIIITLGTSFVYRHKKKNIIVSNCHKIPADEFDLFLLNQEETKNCLQAIVDLLLKLNNKIKVIFTISPVRHWKNGAVDNQLSKANLIIAVHEIIKNNGELFYFPSYEIMMDDLRDYRFYNEDLLHPNKMAIEYIWQKFCDAYFNSETLNSISGVEKLIKAVSHRPRNSESQQHHKFLIQQLSELKKLNSEYPFLNLEDIKEKLQTQIISIK